MRRKRSRKKRSGKKEVQGNQQEKEKKDIRIERKELKYEDEVEDELQKYEKKEKKNINTKTDTSKLDRHTRLNVNNEWNSHTRNIL